VDRGDRAWPLEEAASGDRRDRTGRVGTAGSRGEEGAQSGRCSDVRNVETPSGSRRCLGGRPQGELHPGGNRMPKKRTPVAERRQEPQTTWSAPPLTVWDNWPDTSPGGWVRKGADVGR